MRGRGRGRLGRGKKKKGEGERGGGEGGVAGVLMLLCDWRAHLQTGLCQGLKRSRDPWGPEARLELLVQAIPQFWACCLFSLFLVGFAQPTPKQQQMKVSAPQGTQADFST